MNVKQKLQLDIKGLNDYGAINIVIFGDSVSHGAFGTDDIDYEAVYWHLLEKKLHSVRNYMPINMINSSISGYTATDSLQRIDRDIKAHNPDLVIVSFGLNDINGTTESYCAALKRIYEESRSAGAEVIHMTQNMLNTYVTDGIPENLVKYAHKTASMQNEGRMDEFVEAAKNQAKKSGVTVCDCYAEWKKMSDKGIDTTALLANHINHPCKEMHHLFADKLFKTIMGGENTVSAESSSTMYKG